MFGIEFSGAGITEAILSIAGTVVLFLAKQISSFINEQLAFIKEQRQIDETYKAGIRALLRAEIVRVAKHYCKIGSIPVSASACMTDMYETYHKLGGNGLVTKWYERAMMLPHSDED